jgi:hypothetical protein
MDDGSRVCLSHFGRSKSQKAVNPRRQLKYFNEYTHYNFNIFDVKTFFRNY